MKKIWHRARTYITTNLREKNESVAEIFSVQVLGCCARRSVAIVNQKKNTKKEGDIYAK